MQKINAKIVKHRIVSSYIYVSEDLSKKFDLNMESRAKVKISENEEEKSVLLNIRLNIGTEDEDLKIELVADIIFELDHMPEDYNELAEEELIPMAREMLLNSLDEMLVVMGYRKMELAEKM